MEHSADGKRKPKGWANERSAGGLVLRSSKGKEELLMIRVKNLEGRVLWTFPKGHLEKGETDSAAALREVEEETGWKCRIVPWKGKRTFETVRYPFLRDGRPVRKVVAWFLMEPVEESGTADPEEVMKVRWAAKAQAEKLSAYPSDKKLLKKLKKVWGKV